MRLGFLAAALVGAFSGVCLVFWQGAGAVAAALKLAGWTGLGAITLYHLLPLFLCGLAWRALLDGERPGALPFLWFRWLRDAGNELLAIVPAAGEALSLRAMVLARLDVNRAAATTVVDLTAEMGAQVAFTLIGVALLALARPSGRIVAIAVAGAAALALVVAAFASAQRLGLFRLLERMALKIAADLRLAAPQPVLGVHEAIHALYARRGAVATAAAVHLAAWIVGAGEAKLSFAFMGVAVPWATVLALESLTFAMRSAAFFVPGGIGVQEGGYAVLGAALGIGPEFALALSLLKRGRELVLGLGGLGAWHMLEGRALLRLLRN